MSKNTFQTPEPIAAADSTPLSPESTTPESQKKQSGWWQSFISGNLLLKKSFVANIPFILYVCLLLVTLIYNRYKMEHLVIDTNRLNGEIVALQQRHTAVRMQYQNATRMFKIASKLEPVGISISKEPIKQVIILDNAHDKK